MSIAEFIGAVSIAAWIYLLLGRGSFWLIRETLPPKSDLPRKRIAAIVPARNEEIVVGKAIQSLLGQDHQGELRVFLVDDGSSDGTVAAARRAAAEAGASGRLTVVEAAPLPLGWTGKVWALSEGLKCAADLRSDYFLFTDADIVHAPENVQTLVTRAEAGKLDLVSLMVKLHCQSFAERTLIPAFVFFFFQLYPPDWIADRQRRTAGAAGGCMLIRREALERIGGIETIRSELIDDCALAQRIKPGGDVWLGVTQQTRSIREYPAFADIRRMISRTAFTQLRHSPLLLLATILGMAIVYIAPLMLLLTGKVPAARFGLAAWSMMMVCYAPVLRFYQRSLAWLPLVPLIALFYMWATVDSAIQYWSDRGGAWKGRVQDAR